MIQLCLVSHIQHKGFRKMWNIMQIMKLWSFRGDLYHLSSSVTLISQKVQLTKMFGNPCIKILKYYKHNLPWSLQCVCLSMCSLTADGCMYKLPHLSHTHTHPRTHTDSFTHTHTHTHTRTHTHTHTHPHTDSIHTHTHARTQTVSHTHTHYLTHTHTHTQTVSNTHTHTHTHTHTQTVSHTHTHTHTQQMTCLSSLYRDNTDTHRDTSSCTLCEMSASVFQQVLSHVVPCTSPRCSSERERLRQHRRTRSLSSGCLPARSTLFALWTAARPVSRRLSVV